MNSITHLLGIDSNSFFEDMPVKLGSKDKEATGIIVKIGELNVWVIRRPPYSTSKTQEIYLEIYNIEKRHNKKVYLDLERTQRITPNNEYYYEYNHLLSENE